MSSGSTSGISHQESQARNSGWWETYIIRYLVGTVVGGGILLFLNTSDESGLKENLLPGITGLATLDPGLVAVIAAVGFAYCYIASAPILVLHASRAVLVNSSVRGRLICLAVVSTAAGITAVSLWAMGKDKSLVISLSLLVAILLLQLIPLIAATSRKAQASHDYYIKLSAARADPKPERQEYKESYRHLREHGNAFLILVFEGLLGVVLLGISSAEFALICLLSWIVPAAIVWCHGTWLEARFSQ